MAERYENGARKARLAAHPGAAEAPLEQPSPRLRVPPAYSSTIALVLPVISRFLSRPLRVALLAALALCPLLVAAQPVREARLLLAQDDPAGAVALLAHTPEALDSEGAFTLALAYQALARHAAADSAFARADTADARVLAAWARSAESLGQSRRARGLLARAYARDTTAAPVALAYARALVQAEAWRPAQHVYAGLLAADSANAYLHGRLGYVAYQLRDSLSAIVHYEKALRYNPADKSALLALTRVYLEHDAPLSARRSLDRHLVHHLLEPDVFVRRGEIGLALDDRPYAIASYQAAVALGDSTAPVLRALGAAYYLDGRFTQADSALAWSFRLDDAHARTAYYLALTRLALERHEDALELLRTTAQLMEQSLLGDVYGYVGQVHKTLGSDREAIEAYRLARLLDPGRAEFLYHLATLYDRYYRDRHAVRAAYEAFLDASADAEALAEQRRFAEERLRDLRAEAHLRGEG